MHIHILGICGTFMGGLAALARSAGHRVTGCDAGVYPPMSDQLRALGIDLIEGFAADQLALKPDIFVIGNVVSRARHSNGLPKFPLMEAILNSGAAYTSGPEWLARHILQDMHVLAVAGTHGKTSTSAMLAWILDYAGLQPSFLIGGVPLNFATSARLNLASPKSDSSSAERPFFVIEADEYDTAFFDKRSKFVHYRPRTAILNNLEFDHADIFENLAAIERQFHHLVRTVPSSGRIVVNGLEESLTRVLHMGCWSEVRSFGSTVSDITALGSAHSFSVLQNGTQVANVKWELMGIHNQLNALAAIAAAEHIGVTPATAARALSDFLNVKRRMELRGTVRQICVYDDFAHHPTAIRTTLEGLKNKLEATTVTAQTPHPGRILAVFEPRSNTMKLGAIKAQLPWSLAHADFVFCYAPELDWDVHNALEPLNHSIPNKVCISADMNHLIAQIVQSAQPNDHIVCMSNGSFGNIHARLLEALAKY